MSPRNHNSSRPVRRFIVLAGATALLLGGCASPSSPSVSAQSSGAGSGPITLTNCGQEMTYEHQVTRIVATSNSANVGTLIRIGAVENLAAVSLKQGNDAVLSALYAPGIEDVSRLENSSMESIVAVQPDLLIGSYSGLFSGSSGITVESANDNGIPTYIISDSCRQDPAAGSSSKLGTMSPWDAVRADVQNYGLLTGHEDEAAIALAELNDLLADLENAPMPDKKPRILLFDSGTDELYTSGHNGPPQGIIEAAGGVNVFDDQDTTWFKANWEAVAETQPDVIVVMDYRRGDPNEIPDKLDTIRTQPALADTEVVRQNRIIVLPLVLFTSGYPNLEAAIQVRLGLEELGLAPESGLQGKLPEEMGYGVVDG